MDVLRTANLPPNRRPNLRYITELGGQAKRQSTSTLDRTAIRASWNGADIVAIGFLLSLILGLSVHFSFWI